MVRCPICDYHAGDETICPRCGTALAEVVLASKDIGLKSVREPLVDLVCERCGKGNLVLVTDETDIPRYRCTECGTYRGEFLHTGRETYYSTIELRVGQFISTRLKMKGQLLLPLDDHMGYLARKISQAMDIKPEDVEAAVEGLTKQEIIMIIPKGDHFEVEFR